MNLGMPLLIFALEIAVLGWRDSSLRRLASRSGLIDLAFFALFLSGRMGVVVAICTLGLAPATQVAIASIGLQADTGSAAANMALAILLQSFLAYWLHRAFHTRWLWPIHKLHHSAETLNPLVMHRANPANHALDAISDLWPFLLLPVPPSWVAWYVAAGMAQQLLVHSALPWNWRGGASWLICPPAAHALHHSRNPAHFNRNFAGGLIVWDRIFGTYDLAMP